MAEYSGNYVCVCVLTWLCLQQKALYERVSGTEGVVVDIEKYDGGAPTASAAPM